MESLIELLKGYPEFNPSQARDEHGRWESGGAGPSMMEGHAREKAARDSMAHLEDLGAAVRKDPAKVGRDFLDATKDVLGYVKDGFYDKDAGFWHRMLSLASTAISAVLGISDAIGVGAAAGYIAGTAAGGTIGAAIALSLSAWLIYEKWMQTQDKARAAKEAVATRRRIAYLEDQLTRRHR